MLINTSFVDSLVIRIGTNLVRESFSFSLWQMDPAILFFVLVSVVVFCIIKKTQKKWLIWFFAGLAFLSLSSLYIKPQDDLYSNLLTAFNFRKYGMFSVSRHMLQEGSVEYLYYFLVSLIAGTNKALILYSSVFLGAVSLFVTAYYVCQIIKTLTKRDEFAEIGLLILLLSSYFFNNLYCGYGYNFFMMFFFMGMNFLFKNNYRRAFVIIAFLPLIRQEVLVLYPMIFGIYIFFEKKLSYVWIYWKTHLIYIVSCVVPFAFRFLYYGHVLPVPGISKSNSLFYFSSWIYGFSRLWVVILPLLMLFIIFGFIAFYKNKFISIKKLNVERSLFEKLMMLVVPVTLLTGLYKVNGGDFLYMNRYDMLFFFCLLIVIMAILSLLKKEFSHRDLIYHIFAVIIVSIVFNGALTISLKNYVVNIKKGNTKIFAVRKVTYFNDIGAPYKEGLALFFNDIYSNTVKKIAVVELNTFGYFTKHKIYDMFGTINKDIAYMDPEPRVDLFAGYKKRNPRLLEKYNPEIIIGRHANYWNYDPDFFYKVIKSPYLDYTFFGWGKGCQEYELGGEKYLNFLGYKPVLLIFDNVSFSIRLKERSLSDFYKRVGAKYPLRIIIKKYLMEVAEPELQVIAEKEKKN